MSHRNPIPPPPASPRTTFVLGGGGSLGAAEARILRELLVQGIQPDMVLGVSAGAINVAYFAHQPTLERLESSTHRQSRRPMA